MRIAIFSTHPTFVTHFETELEIAQEFINKGFQIDFFICSDKEIKCCDNVLARALNDKKSYSQTADWVCEFCIQRQLNGFKLLEGDYRIFSLISDNQKNKVYDLNDVYLGSISKFKELVHDECFDVGWAILSSLISYTRNPLIELRKYTKEIKELYSESLKIYESAKQILTNTNYEQIFVFNGRLSYARGLYRLGLKKNLNTIIHERGSVPEKYEFFKNSTYHNINDYYHRVHRYWNEANYFTRKKIGRNYYKKKVMGFGGSWESFTKDFKKNYLPTSFNSQIQNIVLFTSSEDEFASIDCSWDNPFFISQLDGIEFLCKEISSRKSGKQFLYIRIHPNSKNINQKYLDRLYSFSKYDNIELIYPDSNIDSYCLLFHSDRVITFGSTITIESIFWCKPTILLANCEFNQFDGPIKPNNKDEIIDLCFNKKLPKPTKKDAIKIGYYLSNYGINYKYYKALDYKTGYFKGINLSTGEVLKYKEPKILYIFNTIKGVLFKFWVNIIRKRKNV